ncbi:hypothetical protein V491_07820, partial [Pseudogymnoascus sp. VKM F-3775]
TAPPLPTGANARIPPTPEPKPAPKEAETPKTPTTGGNSITLAMRQMGEEAAQKAKDMQKKTLKAKSEVFTGSGTGEAAAKDAKTTETPQVVEPITILQDPKTSAWSLSPAGTAPVSQHALNEMKSLQSPTSTAWKVADISLPITKNVGSGAATASAEKPKPVENKAVTAEEDDDEDEDDDDDDDDEEEGDDDDDDEEDEDEDDEDDEDEDEDDEDEDDDEEGEEGEDKGEGDAKKEPKKA